METINNIFKELVQMDDRTGSGIYSKSEEMLLATKSKKL